MIAIMTGRTDELRRLSSAAFGQSYRLELMLAADRAAAGIVSLTELAREIPDVSVSSLQRPFDSLVESGLLAALPRGDSRHRYFLRNESSAWAWARELRQQVEQSEAAAVD